MAGGLIGALRVSLSAETAQFEAGMKRAQRTANNTRSSFQKSFGGLGNIVKAGFAGVVTGLSIGLITQGVKAALEYAGSLGEISQQLGVTTRDLQVFRYAAGQVGISQEQMEKGLQKLTISLGQLAAGAKAPRAALEGVRKGLADQVLAAKDTGQAFRLIADGLQGISSRSERAAVEVALFGRAGAQLDNLLSGGSSAVNELADAADRLGIVLSDEQIQKADDTADKLEAIKTVLSARVAGVVADNADAILGLADALASIVAVAGKVISALSRIGEAVSRIPQPPAWVMALGAGPGGAAGFFAGSLAGGGKKLTNSATVTLPPARRPVASGGISKFLATGGGGKKSRRSGSDDAARKAEQERRRLFQVEQEGLRAEIDILRARKELASDYSERYALSIQILDLEKQGYEAELAARVADGDLKEAEAQRLKLKNDEIDALERKILIEEEEVQRQRDYNMLEAKDFELKRDILERQAELATNHKERRDVEMRILDLAYREERERLERIVRESKDWAEIEAARRDLLALSQKQGMDREITRRATMGPMESAQFQFGDITDEMEQLKVNGIMGAVDALTQLTDGFGSFKDAAISAIKQVIAEFIRLQLLKLAFSMFGGGAGIGGGSTMGGSMSIGYAGLPGFATGGGFNVLGRKGVDNNLLQLNGLPIARVSHGERVSVSNDNARGGNPVNISFALTGPVSRETMGQIAAKTKLAIASANRKGI